MENGLTNKISVVLADDHPLFREGVARTLMAEPGLEIVGEATDADEAVKLAADLLPDIIMLDISMPGSGLVAAKRIASICPVVKIIMLTASEHDDDVTSALQAGARGYILKGIGGEELIAIVNAVHQGGSYVPPDLAARLLTGARSGAGEGVQRDPLSELTAREEQILKGVARGLSNKEIGRELELQEKTVKHYMTNILQKLQVRNRVEAALVAKEHLPSAD
ncbi:MAG: response regulator transcription factor [Gammaproteobacteria bacterium]|nr:response regulator transcription factor [Gammaproteobacteria bacterium]